MLHVSPGRLVRGLWLGIVAFVVLGVASALVDELVVEGFWPENLQESFVRLFALHEEANVPTWFASALLLLAAALALANAARAGSRAWCPKWLAIAFVFVLMSIDEAAVIHEMAILPLRHFFDLGGLFHFAWIIPGAVVALAVALYLLPFVRRLAEPVRSRLLIAGAVFVSGAIGVEAVSGLVEEQRGRDLLYVLLTVIEEALELLGVLIAVSAMLANLARAPAPFAIHFAAPAPAAAPPARRRAGLASGPARTGSQPLTAPRVRPRTI